MKFKKLASEVELKRRHLVVLSLDASNIDNVHLLKGSSIGVCLFGNQCTDWALAKHGL